MSDVVQFRALAALIVGGFGLFAFMFQRLETRLDACIDRLADEVQQFGRDHRNDMERLRRDLAPSVRVIDRANSRLNVRNRT